MDQGQTGDKVRHSDPAAAPLGTDAEAGGVSPTAGEIALDASATKKAARAEAPARALPGLVIYCGLLLLVTAVIVGVITMAGSGTG